jgi:hypothetical protein
MRGTLILTFAPSTLQYLANAVGSRFTSSNDALSTNRDVPSEREHPHQPRRELDEAAPG